MLSYLSHIRHNSKMLVGQKEENLNFRVNGSDAKEMEGNETS